MKLKHLAIVIYLVTPWLLPFNEKLVDSSKYHDFIFFYRELTVVMAFVILLFIVLLFIDKYGDKEIF